MKNLIEFKSFFKIVVINLYFCLLPLFFLHKDENLIVFMIIYGPILYLMWLIGAFISYYDYRMYHYTIIKFIIIDLLSLSIGFVINVINYGSAFFLKLGLIHKLLQYLLVGGVYTFKRLIKNIIKCRNEKLYSYDVIDIKKETNNSFDS